MHLGTTHATIKLPIPASLDRESFSSWIAAAQLVMAQQDYQIPSSPLRVVLSLPLVRRTGFVQTQIYAIWAAEALILDNTLARDQKIDEVAILTSDELVDPDHMILTIWPTGYERGVPA